VASLSPSAQARLRRLETECVPWKAATTQKCYERVQKYDEKTII